MLKWIFKMYLSLIIFVVGHRYWSSFPGLPSSCLFTTGLYFSARCLLIVGTHQFHALCHWLSRRRFPGLSVLGIFNSIKLEHQPMIRQLSPMALNTEYCWSPQPPPLLKTSVLDTGIIFVNRTITKYKCPSIRV